jgi:YD repeat-containing protein
MSTLLRPGDSIQTYKQLFPEINGASTFQTFNPLKVARVELPDQRSYQFRYNRYGELAIVELPTGGRYEYEWGTGFTGTPNSSGSDGEFAIVRRITARRVYRDSSTPENKTSYSATDVAAGGDQVVTVEVKDANDVLLGKTVHTFHGSSYISQVFTDPVSYPDFRNGRERQTDVYNIVNGSPVLQRRTTNTWVQRTPVSWWTGDPNLAPSKDPRLAETVTTLYDVSPTLVAKKTFGYDQYNNQTDVYEYGFGAGAPGPLLRHTHTDYLTNNPWQGNANYATDLNIHIRNLPTQISVFDGNNTEVSKTSFYYDVYSQFPLQDCPNIVQHDGGFHTGYGPRGNMVKSTKVASFTPASSIDNFFHYDIAGNVVMTKDGRTPAGITTFDFNDRYGTTSGEARSNTPPAGLGGQISYAFPTKVTNALGHEIYTKYDYYLGKPVDSEDQNEVVTSFTYDDALDRLTQVVRGADSSTVKNQTTFDYNDAERTITTTNDRVNFNDNQLKSEVIYDGLGRTVESRQYEPGSSYIAVNTIYDALGRASQVSNPHRLGEPEWWTTTSYDALGRVIRVITPDGAQVNTQYSGNQVTVIDQAGKSRRSETDALGRLTKVIEAPGGVGYETNYEYDTLNNLRKVKQGPQERIFAYDSMSRLTSATNPESGTVTYQYDENGNLTKKTDARNIATDYTYDALNRPVTKTYAGGAFTTPQVKYFYDQQELPSGAPSYNHGFATGRLVAATYSGGSEGDYYGYDELGRVNLKYQRINTTNYLIQATYNRAGMMTSETYPSGHIVNYSHDQAGRLSGFTGNLGGGAAVNYATGIQYNGYGLKSRETYGTQTPLYLNLHYNNRLQLTDLRLGDNSNDKWNWSRGALQFYHGGLAIGQGNPSYPFSVENNGNLLRQVHSVPLAGGGQVSHAHDYTYDPLNRLTSVFEQYQSQNDPLRQVFNQTFSYDQWGNRKIEPAGTGMFSDEVAWVDESVPAGATLVGDGGDSWTLVNSGLSPYSGTAYHQSGLAAGFHQHHFSDATQTLQVNAGDRLYAYIYLDPANPPREVMLGWNGNGSWEHRAYWGENIIDLGVNGTASRRQMGPLPPAGQWVRLEVPASQVGLEGKTLNGMTFTLYGGTANWDQAGKANNGDTI